MRARNLRWPAEEVDVFVSVPPGTLGDPFSAVGCAPELLPQPVGAIGQLMPPRAGANLLRSSAFFDGAAAAGHVVVLVIWALGRLAALLAAGRPSPIRDIYKS